MPLEIQVMYVSGELKNYYIPIDLMRGNKKDIEKFASILPVWGWANPDYFFNVDASRKIKSISIDPSGLLADINLSNNSKVFE